MIVFENESERQLWQRIAVAMAGVINCLESASSIKWADHIVLAFRERQGSKTK